MNINEEAKRLLKKECVELMAEVADLSQKKDVSKKELDVIFFNAKKEASKTIKSAEAGAVKIEKETKKLMADFKGYEKIAREGLQEVKEENGRQLNLANKKTEQAAGELSKVNILRKELMSEVESLKTESKEKMEEALSLNRSVGVFRGQLDEREKELDLREIEQVDKEKALDDRDSTIAKQEDQVAKDMATVKETEAVIDKKKMEVVAGLAEIKETQEYVENKSKENHDIRRSSSELKREAVAETEKNESLLNSLAVDKERNKEQEQYLDEKEKHIILEQRKLNGKIKILKDLRDEKS